MAEYFLCHAMEFEYECKFTGKSKLVDFVVKKNGIEYLFEVKESIAQHVAAGSFAFDPYQMLRGYIDRGAKKFKEYGDYSCNLVIFVQNPSPRLPLEQPYVVFGAMLGNVKFSIDIDSGAVSKFFGDAGKMLVHGAQYNRRISSVIFLRHYFVGIGECMDWNDRLKSGIYGPMPDYGRAVASVVVYENPVADSPLPLDLFRGECDERWRWNDGNISQVFCGEKIRTL